MHRFVCPNSIPGLPYSRTDYQLIQLPSGATPFDQAAAAFFVQSWMSSALPHMLDIWKNWDSSSDEHKRDFISYLDIALFSNGKLIG